MSTGKQLKLKLPTYEVFAGRGCSIPKRVFADIPLLSSTKLAACTFTTQESEGFNPVTYHAQHQDDSITEFAANPAAPIVYSITSSPNDSIANLVAAYLTSVFLSKTSGSFPAYWLNLSQGFDKTVFSSSAKLVVVSSISPVTPSSKLEYAQSVIDHFTGRIPVLVVGTGMDPISLFAGKLYRRPTDLFYYQTALVKRKAEVI